MKVLAAILLSVIMLSSGFFVNSPAVAAPNENANENANRSFKLPDKAIEIAPGIFHIGTAIHQGKVVEGIAAFHHREGHGGGPGGGGPGGGSGGNGSGEKCFSFLAKGAKWKTVEEYIVDPSNSEGLNDGDIRQVIQDAVTAWETSAGSAILGNEVAGIVDGVDEITPDGKNEVLFGNVDSPGAIAVTVTWGIFSGPPQGRELVEWDQLYDQNDYDWAINPDPNNPDPSKMDLLNIAAHEVGHAAGLGHPDNTCVDETMYAFATEGETKKQDLNSGDIAGIQNLY